MEKLKKHAVFHWFYELNQIPRCSNHEEKISNYLLQFAHERDLEVEQDEALNIIIRKPGTVGYEDSPWVSIQGHMDMVCEKEAGSPHDFSKDPIEMVVEDNWLRAKGTTLGADNGIAVAYALALLDAQDIPHPNLEVIITTAEETGMTGALALQARQVKGEYLLNLDSDDEGVFILGCAGGANFTAQFPCVKSTNTTNLPAYTLEVKGLLGGHSGQVIHEGRGNAIKLLARLLQDVKEQKPLQIATICGGSKHNAIPVTASCTFVSSADVETAITKSATEIKAEFAAIEENLEIELKKTSAPAMLLSEEVSTKLLDYLFVVPHGAQVMSPVMEGLVQTSLNVAIVVEDEEKITILHSIRSAVNSSKQELLKRLNYLAQYFGVESEATGGYPAWEFNPHSSLIDKVGRLYQEMYGKEPVITAIHGGLECGLLKEIMPDTDMISFGPNMKDIHTAREKLDIDSALRVWDFLLALLANFR